MINEDKDGNQNKVFHTSQAGTTGKPLLAQDQNQARDIILSCKERVLINEDKKEKEKSLDSPTVTVRYLYEKYKDQGVTMSALYNAAIAAGLPTTGVFDRGRLPTSSLTKSHRTVREIL